MKDESKNLTEMGLPTPEQPVAPEAEPTPTTPETEPTPERPVEVAPEGEPTEAVPQKPEPSVSIPPPVSPAAQVKDPVQQKIESILAEDLEEEYKKLSPAQQKKFQEEGEETASKIAELMRKSKVKVKKIIKLITDWLKILPGVNKYFLEQEAKIKADKMLEISSQSKEEEQ